MTKERVRDNRATTEETQKVASLNVPTFTSVEQARNTIMDRYNTGESVIQPPESTDKTLGEAIKSELAKLR